MNQNDAYMERKQYEATVVYPDRIIVEIVDLGVILFLKYYSHINMKSKKMPSRSGKLLLGGIL